MEKKERRMLFTANAVIEKMRLEAEIFALCVPYINPKMIEKLEHLMKSGKNFFLLGAGRSDLSGKAFGMRFAQTDIKGIKIYIVGETTTIAPKKGDVVIAISTSGETQKVKNLAMQYKAHGAKIALLGAHKASSIGNIADVFVRIPDKNQVLLDNPEFAAKIAKFKNWAVLGTISETFALIFLDSIASEIMTAYGKEESDLEAAHQIE